MGEVIQVDFSNRKRPVVPEKGDIPRKEDLVMKVRCERAHECSYLNCGHHDIHDYEEGCIEDVCQEFDSCTRPGSWIRCKCIPMEE